jgi:tetratricopeptide (TPR) repeat protein
MKRILPISLLLVGGFSVTARAQELSELSLPPNGDNQKAEVAQWIGPVKITIDYHSPRVHLRGTVDRTGHIWGELVRYGFFDDGFGPSTAAPWRAGANETTTITFSDDVKIDGKDLKAGTYALFLDLEKSGPWYWIFSNATGWGSYQYDPKNDALRVPVNPQDAPYTEFLTYGFDNRLPNSAEAFLHWETKRVPFKIDVANVNDIYVARMRQELLAWPGFNYRNWQTAAQFCADNKVDLDEALVWADKAIHEPFRGAVQGREDFSTLQTKAAVLSAMGRDPEADATMDTALRLPGADVMPVHQYGLRTLAAGRAARALTIFKFNRQHHPDDKFATYVGLARGYSAVGDTARAIKNWEIALANVPPNQQANMPSYESALQALKAGRRQSVRKSGS